MPLSVARRALAEAETLPEVTRLIDHAEVLRVAARRAKLSLEAQNDWAEYKLDAERTAGQMLKEMAPKRGPRPDKKGHDVTNNKGHEVTNSPPRLEDIGVTSKQSQRWQMLAELPDEEFEGFKAEARAKEKEITQAGALKLGKHKRREQQKRKRAA